MKTAAEILQFDFSPTAFKQSAESLFTVNLKRLHDSRINKLISVVQELNDKPAQLLPVTEVEDVVKKFKKYANYTTLFKEEFTHREIRTLNESLFYSEKNINSIIDNVDELKMALTLISEHWRDSFLIRLIDTYLRKWDYPKRESMDLLFNFISKQLKAYNGLRQPAQFFKNNIFYLNPNSGDLALGKDIIKNKKSLIELTRFVSIPNSWLTHSYFSRVIVSYYELSKNEIHNFLDNLIETLDKHNNSITNKRVLSKLIIHANTTDFESIQDRIKDIAFRLVGDPANISNEWDAFSKATEQEKTEIREARNILNEWVTRKFITVFFELIQEPRRKNFWNRYSNKISSVRIVGPKAIKAVLKRDERISKLVDGRFHVTNSNRQASAFIMRIKDYAFIEFSVSNYAFYAIKENHPLIKNYESRQINSADEFVDSSMPMLAKRKYANIEEENLEGRLFHRDGTYEGGSTLRWETVFDWWIKKYLEVSV